MKRISIIFILLLVFLFGSCRDNNIPQNNNQDPKSNEEENKEEDKEMASIIIKNDDIMMSLSDTLVLELEKNNDPVYSYNYDENIIRVFDDVIIPNNVGTTSLELVFNNEVIKKITVIIYEKPDVVKFVDLPETLKINEEAIIKTNVNDVIITVTGDSAFYDEELKTIKGLSVGSITVTANYIYDQSLSVSKTIQIKKEAVPANFTLVDSNVNAKINEEVELRDFKFVYGVNLFSTIEDALNSESEIYVGYINEQEITINKSNITLYGTMLEDPLEIKITFENAVSNITIKDFMFSGDSKIVFLGGNKNIEITNNKFLDITSVAGTWQETNKYTGGIIEFRNSTSYHNNIVIKRNTFNNVSECCINISTAHNVLVENNTFNDFHRDGVRFNHGIIQEECTWNVSKNIFKDGDYSAVYLRTYGSDSSEIYHYVDIRENEFIAVAKKDGEFIASVTLRNYQEGGACVDIAYNTFTGSNKFIFLRNNATSSHQTNFHGYVTGNTFTTVPAKYYFNNLNSSSDTESTNPRQTKLVHNAFMDDGSDIKPDAKLFIGNYNNTTLSYKRVEKLYHFNLHHVLFVDKKVKLLDDVSSIDDGKFEITPLSITPLFGGTYYLQHDDDSFEVVCIKNIELVVKFINIALGEIGYQEMDANGNTGTSGNYTKYGAWYGINPGAWCAMYVSWCANQARVPTSIIPKYAAVQSGMDWYKDKGLFQYKENYTPKAGDIMFMKSNGASHTGIVLYCDGVTLYTVEGNTSDCCALRKYSVNNAKITGYGTPDWPYYNPNGYNFSNGEAQDGSGHSTT